jgi:predicted RNA-binding Zn-ribbon protein involved in translation (DUF1610 family)
MAPASSRSSSAASTPRPKNVLFCPSCGHESPTDGDWQRQTRGNETVYRCPPCGDELTVRPTDGLPPVSNPGETTNISVLARSVELAADSVWLAVAWPAWTCTSGKRCSGTLSRRR